MSIQAKFQALKDLDFTSCTVSLAVVREYKRDRVSHYIVRYVPTDEKLETRLRSIMLRKINSANAFEEYTYDCPEPEEDLVRTLEYESTDFFRIIESLSELNPEENIIESVEELVMSKSYLIVLRNEEGIQVVGFKRLPENWKMKKNKGLIPLLFRENRFEDLEDENVFSISNSVDFIYYNEFLFILSKKDFETGLNFRKGMMAKAEVFYEEVKKTELFVNMEVLTNRVGNNQRYLRKIATVKNLGYYRDQQFLQRFRQVSERKDWGVQFENGQIVITEETLDTVLAVLQNKRLHSELTVEDFDVEHAKSINLNTQPRI